MRSIIRISKLALLSILLLSTHSLFAQSEESQAEAALKSLPDVTVISKTVIYNPYSIQYLLSIKQPVDHNDTTKGFLYQQIHLNHKGFDKPMVMETEGYDGRAAVSELEKILHANEMDIEFRYFNESKPDSMMWDYLTFEQATADLHHINQVFKQLYHSKWITTGISRGGETTMIYRYFYPNDVDASVPYVAPMPNDFEDKRVYNFQDTAGGPSCVRKIKHVQTYLLAHEAQAIAKLPSPEKMLHYTWIGSLGAAYEIAVLEYPFAFWQITTMKEKDIPTVDNLDSMMNQLYNTFGSYIASFSDEQNEGFLPHAYMTWQMGYYKYRLAPFKQYLHYLKGENPSSAFLPPSLPRKAYDPSFDKKVNAWIYDNGNNIVCIYGARDTWTACQAAFSPKTNAKKYYVPGANHYYARIRFMPPEMQEEFAKTLESMTGLTVDLESLK